MAKTKEQSIPPAGLQDTVPFLNSERVTSSHIVKTPAVTQKAQPVDKTFESENAKACNEDSKSEDAKPLGEALDLKSEDAEPSDGDFDEADSFDSALQELETLLIAIRNRRDAQLMIEDFRESRRGARAAVRQKMRRFLQATERI